MDGEEKIVYDTDEESVRNRSREASSGAWSDNNYPTKTT